jgi:hypothetical protein
LNLLIDARRPLLEGILDYDATTEISDTSMKQAVSEYREAIAGPHGWVVGRFVCPSSRLEELVGLLTASMVPGERPWQVGVAIDEELGAAAMHAGVFHTYMDPAGAVTSLEPIANHGLGTSATSLATAASGISANTIAYTELGAEADDRDIAALAELAELRIQLVGALLDLGQRPHDPMRLATVILASAQGGVSVKVRSPLPLDAMLLQLLTAASVAHRDATIDRPMDVLATDSSRDVTATAVGLRWQDDLFGVPAIKKARSTLHSWRSHDLDTDLRQLVGLGLL